MPKGKYLYQCDHCKRYLLEGIEVGLRVFCNERCRREHSSAARILGSKPRDGGSSPPASANFPDELFERLAINYLVEDLGASITDPDFPCWLERCTKLFERYKPLQERCARPLGTQWGEDNPEVIDECLDLLERKIAGAEAVLLDNPTRADDTQA